MKATGVACGKVILLGEHVVVFGAPALAAGISRGARAEATSLPPGPPSQLRLAGEVILADASSSDDRARAFAALLEEGGAAGQVAVEAVSDLPPGGGLGSSAALGVAIARAVTDLERSIGRETDGLARAVAWERVFHGNPSGIDTAAAVSGGVFQFTRGRGVEPLTPRDDVMLCVGSTGTSSSTRAMVEGLARLRTREPDLVERAIVGVTGLVAEARAALERGDLTALGTLMNRNQTILARILLSTEPIERLCDLARGAGALGAKLTGAGGGGSVIALAGAPGANADAIAKRILSAWRDAGFSGFTTHLGTKGPPA